MSNLSEYEKKRLENIRANEALLRGLDLPTKKAVGEKKSLKKHIPKPTPKKPQQATRVSARIRGKEPDLTNLEYTEPTMKRQKFNEKTDEVMSEQDQKKFLGVLEDALKVPNTIPTIKKEYEPKEIKSYASLQNTLQKLEIRHEWTTVKVTASRITNCVFHPSQSKILGCAADTDGWIGFWDVNSQEENGDPVTYKYRPHRRTVTDMHFNPVDNSKLLSSSYDGFIRVFDMNTAKFDTLELGSNRYSISGFDMTQDGHCTWFTTSDGELGFADTRAEKNAVAYRVKDKKIGCVHLNPVHQHLMALASNDRTSTIWDLRMWNNSDEVEPLQSIQHGYSVTSNYWSPNGVMLATTAYDSFIRLFDLNEEKTLDLKTAIKHNCVTG
ncbi:hypothetical protein INT46_003925, partial [Mucor plumbeus]